jgi:hypothetical protein
MQILQARDGVQQAQLPLQAHNQKWEVRCYHWMLVGDLHKLQVWNGLQTQTQLRK